MMRVEEYGNAIAIISRYPFFGIGFGGPPLVDLRVGVSSLYLLIAEQMGVLALICFLVVAFGILARSSRLRPSPDGALHGMFSAVEAGLVAALVAGLFDHYFFNLNFRILAMHPMRPQQRLRRRANARRSRRARGQSRARADRALQPRPRKARKREP